MNLDVPIGPKPGDNRALAATPNPPAARTATLARGVAVGVLGVLLAACSAASSGDGTHTAGVDQGATHRAAGVPHSLRATRVVAFTLIDGRRAWADSEQREVAGSLWSFDDVGSFHWRTTDTNDLSADLNGVTGQYTSDGATITFQGRRTVDRSGVGSASLQVSGAATPSGTGYDVTMQMVSSARSGAVVDGQNFTGATTAANSSTIEASTS